MNVLLTGGYGCIGSWIAKNLLERGDRVWSYDLKEDPKRMRLIMPDAEVGAPEEKASRRIGPATS